MSLFRRLFLAVLPVPILFAVVAYFWLMKVQAEGLRSQEMVRAQAMAQCLASSCAFALERGDPGLLQVSLNAMYLHQDVAWVDAVDERGVWIAHYDPSLIGGRASEVQVDPRILTAIVPIQWRNQNWGQLRLGLKVERLEQALAKSGNSFLWMSLIMLGVTGVLVGALAHRLTQPISRLAQLAAEIALGKVEIQTVADRMSRDGSQARRNSDGMYELRVLSRGFLQMSQRMNDAMEHERVQLQDLQSQVSALLHYQEAIAAGDSLAEVGPLNEAEFLSLAQALQQMALNLQQNAHSECDYRSQLEEFNRALQETRGRLEETDRYKNEFLGVVSHELRTPLTSVRAFAEILLDYPPEDAQERRDFVNIIYRESDRLTRIINHLLDISRIESKRMRWRLAPVNLVHLLESQLSSLEADIQKVTVELEIAFLAGGYHLWLDGEKVGEALEAVLSNALLHSPPGGRVKISLRPADREVPAVELAIADQGPGIPPESQELIFSKFQRVRLGDEPRGTGLSLALARAIVEAHQGHLHVDSDGHLGSVFVFWLPRNSPPEASP